MKYLIDPKNIINFDRTPDEVEAFYLFCVLVAGKNAQIQAHKLAEFLEPAAELGMTPFEYIKGLLYLDKLDEEIRAHKLGQYKRLHKCFEQSIELNLAECTLEELEGVFGVGLKTARFFLVYTREDSEYAVLDTHIIRWMNESFGFDHPRVTPGAKLYVQLEELFVFYAREIGKTVAELDLGIWKQYNREVNYSGSA